MGRLYRLALAFGALTVLLAFVGALYQLIGDWGDAQRFPQRGRLVQVGTLKLNIDCTGERGDLGSPEVILEGGMGTPAIGWIAVQPEVATFTRVCSYDRAGYGWSDAGPEPRTSSQAAQELKALLNAAGEKSPYILVGHSLGGFNCECSSDFIRLMLSELFWQMVLMKMRTSVLMNYCRLKS